VRASQLHRSRVLALLFWRGIAVSLKRSPARGSEPIGAVCLLVNQKWPLVRLGLFPHSLAINANNESLTR
jgi:hypothetical protein